MYIKEDPLINYRYIYIYMINQGFKHATEKFVSKVIVKTITEDKHERKYQ